MDPNTTERVAFTGARGRHGRVAATRARILDAAINRFVDDGYAATTVEAIAQDADVAVQTIYNVFGSKSRTLAAALDRAVTGTDAPLPTVEVLGLELDAAEHPDEVVDVLVSFFSGAHARTAPIYRLIREASAVDPELAVLWRSIDRRRLDTLEQVCAKLADGGVLRGSVSARDAAARLWTLGSPHAYAFFLGEAGWSQRRYRRWLRDSLAHAIFSVPDGPSV
jgi:AcrR family transcriptional regulator